MTETAAGETDILVGISTVVVSISSSFSSFIHFFINLGYSFLVHQLFELFISAHSFTHPLDDPFMRLCSTEVCGPQIMHE